MICRANGLAVIAERCKLLDFGGALNYSCQRVFFTTVIRFIASLSTTVVKNLSVDIDFTVDCTYNLMLFFFIVKRKPLSFQAVDCTDTAGTYVKYVRCGHLCYDVHTPS